MPRPSRSSDSSPQPIPVDMKECLSRLRDWADLFFTAIEWCLHDASQWRFDQRLHAFSIGAPQSKDLSITTLEDAANSDWPGGRPEKIWFLADDGLEYWVYLGSIIVSDDGTVSVEDEWFRYFGNITDDEGQTLRNPTFHPSYPVVRIEYAMEAARIPWALLANRLCAAAKEVSPPISVPEFPWPESADFPQFANALALWRYATRHPDSIVRLLDEVDRRRADAMERIDKAAGIRLPTPTQLKPLNAKDDSRDQALNRLLSVYSNGVSDERIRKALDILDAGGTVNEKLYGIDRLIPFPPTASAKTLGKLVNVSGTAVQATDWWKRKRKGKKTEVIDARLKKHQQLSNLRESTRDGPGCDE